MGTKVKRDPATLRELADEFDADRREYEGFASKLRSESDDPANARHRDSLRERASFCEGIVYRAKHLAKKLRNRATRAERGLS